MSLYNIRVKNSLAVTEYFTVSEQLCMSEELYNHHRSAECLLLRADVTNLLGSTGAVGATGDTGYTGFTGRTGIVSTHSIVHRIPFSVFIVHLHKSCAQHNIVTVILSVCLSVCLSHSSIYVKMVKLATKTLERHGSPIIILYSEQMPVFL